MVPTMVSQSDFDALVKRVEALEKSAQAPAVVGDNLPATTGKAQRAKRLPQGWVPPVAVVEQIQAEFPTVHRDEFLAEHRKFSDYWHGVAGQRGTKLDWDGTWRNWMRRAFEKRHPAGSGAMSAVDAKAASYLD